MSNPLQNTEDKQNNKHNKLFANKVTSVQLANAIIYRFFYEQGQNLHEPNKMIPKL